MIDDLLAEWVAVRQRQAVVEAEIVRTFAAGIISKISGGSFKVGPSLTIGPMGKTPSVVFMIQAVAGELTSPFWFADISKAVLARFPEHKAKIKRGVYSGTHHLIKRGYFERIKDGLRLAKPEEGPTPEPNNQVESEESNS